ncbi:copper ABC transporter substrate-binding protein [Salmonella enterica]|nr:copper ABC transporter substrate-binding protein [Salmonella enterica]EDX5193443.1 copper ABC transporter substrate-binding protein [Salmonella enterica subsp. enterica serovar Glostrup]EJB9810826.1 copper-binding protein [Salmonella enterica]
MHQLMKTVFLGILSLIIVQAVHAGESHQNMQMSQGDMNAKQPIISATGIVKCVDFKNKKIAIAHETIPSIGWPAMTMRFTLTTQNGDITALKSGNKVNFTFVQQGNISLLQNIHVTQP